MMGQWRVGSDGKKNRRWQFKTGTGGGKWVLVAKSGASVGGDG